jgi:predicted phage terminase large subunit-like protein
VIDPGQPEPLTAPERPGQGATIAFPVPTTPPLTIETEDQAEQVDVDFVPFWEFLQTAVKCCNVSMVLREEHHEVAEMYEKAILGELQGYEYFIVDMPRRVGKTKILQFLADWMFGEFPDAQMMYGCYSEKLVRRSIAYTLRVMRQEWFRQMYGDLVHTRSSELITTLAGGTLYGAGTQATVGGMGAGLKEPAGGFIALDDPANPAGSLSPVQRENTIENFETAWKGCRNSDRWCPIFINAQRIGPDDLPGYVMSTYRNKTLVLKFPCYVGAGTGFHEELPLQSKFPETWGLDTWHELGRTRITRFVRAAQWQQEPTVLGGNFIPVGCFGRYDLRDVRSMKFDKLMIAVDTALKTKEANDFSAACLWGLLDKRAYLIDVLHGKWEAPELIKNTTVFWEKWKNQPGWPRPRMIIEEKAAGTPLLQQLNRDGVPAKGIERDIDKVRRVQNVLPYIEAGMALIPNNQATDGYQPPDWLAKWETEHTEFTQTGQHAHDDLVDCTADCLENLLARKLSGFDVMLDKKP